ncbi:hypothetical protein [Primorskyibacter flagellatus]|uniref:Uncharacterized protein n=1 Tax=Primorskyibacter flagellatus TaxID=1387277 RepID=A0A1W1ZYS6_9RHOB|nr:hypothetical protein [Primorskyibacter flagellatus]SMC53543.1 hypothetical protein SAMN06295998_102259 [Primorskyibacter flagellatus]
MAGSPADLSLKVSGGRIVAAATPGPATYLPCGTRLVFVSDTDAGNAVAIDAEPRGDPLPDVIARALPKLSPGSALRAWTVLEVVAKLTGTPILTVLRTVPAETLIRLDRRNVELLWHGKTIKIERHDTDDVWLAMGRLA